MRCSTLQTHGETLTQEEKMELLQQLAEHQGIHLEERPEESSDEIALVTRAQKKRAQSQQETQEDAIKSKEENVDTSQKEDEENASRVQGIIGTTDDNIPVQLGSAMKSSDV